MRINMYTCQQCGGRTTTVDRDEGVTPFMIACRARLGCDGMMYSSFYKPPADAPPPTFEWFKPTMAEARAQGPAMAEHVWKGGLDIRPITKDVS